MIPAKPVDRAISNIKYRLGKYYVRMGLTPFPPKVRVCRDFSNPSPPRDAYVINEWRPIVSALKNCSLNSREVFEFKHINNVYYY